jgi:hypothetical protein
VLEKARVEEVRIGRLFQDVPPGADQTVAELIAQGYVPQRRVEDDPCISFVDTR